MSVIENINSLPTQVALSPLNEKQQTTGDSKDSKKENTSSSKPKKVRTQRVVKKKIPKNKDRLNNGGPLVLINSGPTQSPTSINEKPAVAQASSSIFSSVVAQASAPAVSLLNNASSTTSSILNRATGYFSTIGTAARALSNSMSKGIVSMSMLSGVIVQNITETVSNLMIMTKNIHSYVNEKFPEYNAKSMYEEGGLFNINYETLLMTNRLNSANDPTYEKIYKFFICSKEEQEIFNDRNDENDDTEDTTKIRTQIVDFLGSSAFAELQISSGYYDLISQALDKSIEKAQLYITQDQIKGFSEKLNDIKNLISSANDEEIITNLMEAIDNYESVKAQTKENAENFYRTTDFMKNTLYYAMNYNSSNSTHEDLILNFPVGVKQQKYISLNRVFAPKNPRTQQILNYMLSHISLVQDWYKIYILYVSREIMGIDQLTLNTRISLISAISDYIMRLHAENNKITLK